MTKEELEQKAEKKYCKNCKLRTEQCLWAWRRTNGLDMPNEKNCSCKEVPAYIAGATEATKELQKKLFTTEGRLSLARALLNQWLHGGENNINIVSDTQRFLEAKE